MMNPIKFFWIDKDYDGQFNYDTNKILKSISEYITLKTFRELDSAFEEMKKLSFEVIFVMVRGRTYQNYYEKLKEIKSTLNCIPKSIIYTSTSFRKVLEGKEIDKEGIIKKETLDSIGDEYYNPGKVCNLPSEILQFIESTLGVSLYKETNLNVFHFEYISKDFENILIECLYSKAKTRDYIIKDLSQITKFCIKLGKDHPSNALKEFNDVVLKSDKIPFELITKFWIKYYTAETTFYKTMHKEFRDNNFSNFNIFIKALYRGLSKKYLNSKFNVPLYYYYPIKKTDLENLENNLNKSKKELIYSRQLLSFSQDMNISLNFLSKIEDSNLIPALYELNISKSNDPFATNIEIGELSMFPNDKEVTFLPFSCFVIDDKIEEGTFGKLKYKKIKLNYLGNYNDRINDIISKTNEKQISDLIKTGSNQFIKDIVKKFENENPNSDKNDLIKFLFIEAELIKENMKNKKEHKNEIEIKMEKEGKFLGDEFFNKYHWMLDIYFNDVLQEVATNEVNDMIPNLIKIKINYPLFDCEKMFYLCENITEIKFKVIDTSCVETMNSMFMGCNSLKKVNFDMFDTSNVTDMSYMFYECFSLKTLDLSNFQTNNVITMSVMFYLCTSLENLNFDLSKMKTDKLMDISFMFRGCKVKNYDISKFDVEKIKKKDGFI